MTLLSAWFQTHPDPIPVPVTDIAGLAPLTPAKAVAEGASPQPPLSKRAILSVPSVFSAPPPLRLHRPTAEEAETSAGTMPS